MPQFDKSKLNNKDYVLKFLKEHKQPHWFLKNDFTDIGKD